MLGYEPNAKHIASLALEDVQSFEQKREKGEAKWVMIIKFNTGMEYSPIIPEIGSRTSDLLILETKDKACVTSVQKNYRLCAKRAREADVNQTLSQVERHRITSQYWEFREEEKAEYDALRESIEVKKQALRKCNKKLQRIQVHILQKDADGDASTYTQLDFDAAQGDVDATYDSLREDQARLQVIMEKKKAIEEELQEETLKANKAGARKIRTERRPELHMGIAPQSRIESMLSPVA